MRENTLNFNGMSKVSRLHKHDRSQSSLKQLPTHPRKQSNRREQISKSETHHARWRGNALPASGEDSAGGGGETHFQRESQPSTLQFPFMLKQFSSSWRRSKGKEKHTMQDGEAMYCPQVVKTAHVAAQLAGA